MSRITQQTQLTHTSHTHTSHIACVTCHTTAHRARAGGLWHPAQQEAAKHHVQEEGQGRHQLHQQLPGAHAAGPGGSQGRVRRVQVRVCWLRVLLACVCAVVLVCRHMCVHGGCMVCAAVQMAHSDMWMQRRSRVHVTHRACHALERHAGCIMRTCTWPMTTTSTTWWTSSRAGARVLSVTHRHRHVCAVCLV
jgi:hypothetical protein